MSGGFAELPDDQKPEIAYPGPWRYTIIGEEEAALRAAVREVVGGDEHELDAARQSRKGNYASMHLKVQVRDEAHRQAVYRGLQEHPAVRLVL